MFVLVCVRAHVCVCVCVCVYDEYAAIVFEVSAQQFLPAYIPHFLVGLKLPCLVHSIPHLLSSLTLILFSL